MKLIRNREHVINMGNYESLRIGATVEVELENSPTQVEYDAADRLLSEALAADIKEAGELTAIHDSYILSWRENNK